MIMIYYHIFPRVHGNKGHFYNFVLGIYILFLIIFTEYNNKLYWSINLLTFLLLIIFCTYVTRLFKIISLNLIS